MNCDGGRKNMASPRRASAAGRGLPWWWRAFSKANTRSEQLYEISMEIKKVGVLGCGLMGSGIAQVAASTGFDVTVLEAEQRFLDKGFASIEKSLDKFVGKPPEKGGITAEQRKEIRSRLTGTTNRQDLANCDIVVEAIIENVDAKKEMYAALDRIAKRDAIFASNTSSISITELAASTQRPDRFVGLHFF